MKKKNELNIKYLFIGFSYSMCIIVLILVFIVGRTFNVSYERLTGDPTLLYNVNPFTGVLSNLGILLWCATVSISYFTGILLITKKQKLLAYFFIASGVLTSILLIDDLFMFHDRILHSFESFNVLEPVTYTIYSILFLAYILKFWRLILKQYYLILFLAFVFFGSSVLTDMLFENKGIQYLIEDGFKFIGIVSWFLFFILSAFNALTKKDLAVK